MTVPQFILDDAHPLRSHRGPDRPWLVDVRQPFPNDLRFAEAGTLLLQNATGRTYHLEEVRERVFGLANALSGLYGISAFTASLGGSSC